MTFAPPLSKLAQSGIGVAAAPTGGMGLALNDKGFVPATALAGEWIALAFGANWSNYNAAVASCAYLKDAMGWVKLKGSATKSGTPAAGDVIGTLPLGFRPELEEYFPCATGATSAAGELRVEADGDIVWLAGSTNETDYTSLSGISFRAA
jgi:hypothetical protein